MVASTTTGREEAQHMITSRIHSGIITNKLRCVAVVVALLGATAMSLGAAGPAIAMRKCTVLGGKYPACVHLPGSCALPDEWLPNGELAWGEYEEGETAIIKGDVYVCQGGSWYYLGLTLPPSPPVHVGAVARIPPVLAPIS
jgi:hypothetical protein